MRIPLDQLQEGAWVDVLDYVPWSVHKKSLYMMSKMDSDNNIDNTTAEDHDSFNETVFREMVTGWHFKRPNSEVYYDRAPKDLTPADFNSIDGRVGMIVRFYTNKLINTPPEGAASDPN